MTDEQAAAFAREWIEAWNSHDLDRILAHYDEHVEFRSPFVIAITGDPSGRLVGRERLRAYFAEALKRYPDLRFTLYHAFAGVSSVVLHYLSVKNLQAAEVMTLDAAGRAVRVDCHYSK